MGDVQRNEVTSDKMTGRECVGRGWRRPLCRGDCGASVRMGSRDKTEVCLESVPGRRVWFV